MNNNIFFKDQSIRHLKVLGIPLDVDFSINDVKSAYRYRANLYHPDKNKTYNSTEKNETYK